MGFWVSPNESLFWETLVFYRFKDAGVKLREANILSNWPWPPRLLQQWEFPPGSHSWLLDMGSQCAKKGTHKDGIDCLNVPSGPFPPQVLKLDEKSPQQSHTIPNHGWIMDGFGTSFAPHFEAAGRGEANWAKPRETTGHGMLEDMAQVPPNSGLRYPQFWWFVEDMAQEHCNVPGRCNRSKFFSSFCIFFYIF